MSEKHLYREPGGHLNPANEMAWVNRWEAQRVFERSVENRRGKKPFVFFEGPPTANGKPHSGHLLTKAIKDLFPRYRTMLGEYCERKAGWDTHGLPVEIEVEKSLGLKSREEVVEFGVEKFNQLCRDSVWKYKGDWEETVRRGGFWIDMKHPYVTLDNSYIESVWWVLKQLHQKGLLYKGHKVVPYCPLTGTVLSSHEVSQGYKEVEDPSVFVLMQREGSDEFFMVWTTTPWTLISNVALALKADADYARVKLADGRVVILAAALVGKALEREEAPYEILGTVKGSELVGSRYTRLFEDLPLEKGQVVVAADFVTLSDGTGIVHIAPAFGQDDYTVGRAQGFSHLDPMTPQGTFSDAVSWLSGTYFKDADKPVLKNLKDRGLLFRREQFKHNYPFNWRRPDSPLMYYARSSWFIEMTKVRKDLLKNNKTIGWHPEHIRDGRFGDFLDNVVDWALSRNRFWGTPLPIWECSDCDHLEVVGSVKELSELCGQDLKELDLHKPHVDKIGFVCPHCKKGQMTRIPEVADVWFDSGAMPYAQWHYPFEDTEKFDSRYPADFISEAIDQTRGWFYSLLAIATALGKPPPYKNCLVMGHVLGEDGQKMSKSKGNVVDGMAMMEQYGADAVRWALYSGSHPWLPARFGPTVVKEAQQRFLGVWFNVYSFFVLYANLDEFRAEENEVAFENRHELDRWIFSRLSQTTKEVRNCLNDFNPMPAAKALERFMVEDVSHWYLRRSRDRFWASEWTTDKKAAFLTLHEVLVTFAKLAAPFVPFISEDIWTNLSRAGETESVHLCDYPDARPAQENLELEKRMDLARKLSELGRSLRQESRMKVRQPLGRVLLRVPDALKAGVEEVWPVVAEEINVKKLEFTTDVAAYATITTQLDFKAAGPVFGSKVQEIQRQLQACDPVGVLSNLEKEKGLKLAADGGEETLTPDMVSVRVAAKPGFACGREGDLWMFMDLALNPELIQEGLAREFNNRINARRKEMNLQVDQRVEARVSADSEVQAALKQFEAYLKENGMLTGIVFSEADLGEDIAETELNQHKIKFVLVV